MKKVFLIILTIMSAVACIQKYDDTAIWDELRNHEKRIEALETLCDQFNTNIISLQTIVTALQNNDFVTDITPLTDNGIDIGYTITFSKSGEVTIFHGKDGKDGKDGDTPVIGVKQDTDGVYYWTLDGQWIVDQNGKKIPTTGKDGEDGKDGVDGKDGEDGKDGADGKDGENGKDGKDGEDGKDGADGKDGENGKDGTTPELKIEDGYWYLTYDNGENWILLDKAVGEDGADGKDGDSFFEDITEDSKCIYITLIDGTCLAVPKYLELNIEFDKSNMTEVNINSEICIDYYVTSSSDAVQIEVMPSNDLRAEVIADDSSNKTGKILISTGNSLDSASKVLVFVTDNNKVIMKSITLTIADESEVSQLYIHNGDTKSVTSAGGVITLSFLTNVDCKVSIPEDAESWISTADVKSLDLKHIQLNIAENTSERRSAIVTIESVDGKLSVEYTILQAGRGSSSTPSVDNNGTIVGKPAANEIFYISTDESIISPSQSGLDAVILSNTYDNGVGVILFDRPVTRVGGFSYQYKLKEIVLPDGVLELGENAFNSCESLTNINIPPTVTHIGKSAFSTSSSSSKLKIESIFIPSSVKYIGAGAFFWCSDLKTVHISDLKAWCSIECGSEYGHYYDASPTYNGADLYLNGEIVTEVVVPDDLSSVGNFAGCNSITEVIIPEGVTKIRNSAFYGCKNLSSISLPESLTIIDDRAFMNCVNLPEVNIPESITEIDTYSFYNCKSLININIPDKVKALYGYTFSNCTSLQEVTFGENFKSYRENEFNNTYYLNEVYFKSETPPVHYNNNSETLFDCLDVNVNIYVPENSVEVYRESPAFANFVEKITGY